MTLLQRRKTLLEKQGGLTQPVVNNAEWLYLFENETRHTVMIEGYFSGKGEVSEVIMKQTEADTNTKRAVLGYFDAASLMYEYAYQQWKNKEDFQLRLTEIKMAHSLLMRETQGIKGGEWRNGDILIQGAEIKPIFGALTDEAMHQFITYTHQLSFEPEFITQSLAKIHAYFEATHPFEDGNGRVGRLLINYILISHGYPSIIIKGTEKDKKKYFNGLEQAEKGLHAYYPSQIPTLDRDKDGDSSILQSIIQTGLFLSMDYLILRSEENLVPVHEIVTGQGYDKSYARQLINRGQVIAKKIGNTRYTKPEYVRKGKKGE